MPACLSISRKDWEARSLRLSTNGSSKHPNRLNRPSPVFKESNSWKSQGKSEGAEKNNNRGTLKEDVTVADQGITYPTDLKLLNTPRENLERIIDLLYLRSADGTKPRTYRRIAREHSLNIAKKKQKTKKQIRRGIRGQLQYISRYIKIVDSLLLKPGQAGLLEKRDRELMETIRKVYSQQKLMYENKTHQCRNRIVNLSSPMCVRLSGAKRKWNLV
ncbi:hypothetical protein [Sunxiuqinia indica]|uniref:hypothetical protein n=1 Tax=Sunxiuqinia indica TaxID=2692584 RepID=UPI001357DB0D|nr:hypothetical protein [Sunxiuqinia indica]